MTDTNELREAIKLCLQKGLTVTTIAWDDKLTDAFDTWLTINNQKFGITLDKTGIIDLLTSQVQLAYKQGYIDGGIEQLTTMDKNA